MNAMAYEERLRKGLRQKLLAIGTQILQSTSTRAILQEVAQAFAQHSEFRRVGVSLYAAPVKPNQQDPPVIAEYITVGPSAEQEHLIRQHVAGGKLPTDRQILETGQPIGPALYITPERLPELKDYAVVVSEPGTNWGPYDVLYLLLRSGDQILGRIALSDPCDGQVPTVEELEPLALLANLATLAVMNARQLRALREQQQRLQQQARLDPLTEVYNRRALDEALQHLERERKPFALVFIDADDFYTVNDRFGHAVGDRIICGLANFLRKNIRSSDSLFRYGGDEFIILMPQTTRQEAEHVLVRLDERFNELRAHWAERYEGLELSISLGISDWSPEAPCPLEAVFEEADQFMYRRKRAGRSSAQLRS